MASTNTTPFPARDPAQKSCYLCDEQNPGDFSPTTKHLSHCLLCSRFFCRVHQATYGEGVCNTNHSTYYHQCLVQAKNDLAQNNPDGTARRDEAENVLMERGVFPSIGEREKTIYRMSPVTDDVIKQAEQIRSVDAEIAKMKGQTGAALIEEVDIHEAEIGI